MEIEASSSSWWSKLSRLTNRGASAGLHAVVHAKLVWIQLHPVLQNSSAVSLSQSSPCQTLIFILKQLNPFFTETTAFLNTCYLFCGFHRQKKAERSHARSFRPQQKYYQRHFLLFQAFAFKIVRMLTDKDMLQAWLLCENLKLAIRKQDKCFIFP